MWDELRIVGVVGITLAALVALIFMMILPLEAKSCREDWAGSAYQARYGFWTNCQILTDRGWIPASSYRTMDKR